MCGLIYIQDFNGNPVNNALMQQFDKQRSRGVQGFGLFDGQFRHMVKTVTEDKMLKWLVKYDSNLLMFHHRYPTSTKNVKRAAHPFSTRDYFGDTQYIMVHNGVVKNADKLFSKHVEQGIEYKTLMPDLKFNDSEALLWDFALTMEGKQTGLHAQGDMAIIVMKLVDGELDRLYFGRNSFRPLKMHRDADTFELTSEGRGEVVQAHQLFTYNYKLNRLTQKYFEFPTYYQPTSYTPVSNYNNTCGYGGYDSYGSRDPEWDYFSPHSMHEPYDEYDYPSSYTPKQSKVAKVGEVLKAAAKAWLPDEVVELVVSDQAIRSRALEYLLATGGHFESAYWQAEFDYDEALEAAEFEMFSTQLDYECRLLEQVMAYINDDDEYLDESSISSTVRSMTWPASKSLPATT